MTDGPTKRNRELEQQRKRREKEERRALRRERGPSTPQVVTADMVQRGLPSIEEAMRNIEERARGGGRVSAATIPIRLFVAGLSDDVTDALLREVFGRFGPVAEATVMRDRATRAPRGFGFVTMADRRDGPKAISGLDGTELNGRRLAVNVATER